VTDEPETTRVLALLRRHGFNTTSFQALEDGITYWWHDEDACVAYADDGAAWVAAGAPIAAEVRLEDVARAFAGVARASGRRAVFFASQERLAASTHFSSVPVGLQPVWDPREWSRVAESSRSFRYQLNRARTKGVSIRSVDPCELTDPTTSDRRGIERLIERWLANRRMSPMRFLVRVEPFSFAAERRAFVAEVDSEIVGFLSAVPVYARGGWFIEDVVRARHAPNGTVESLVDAAMRRAALDGSSWATLGLVPLAGPVPRWMRRIGWLTRPLYDFAGLFAFKSKLSPSRWEPVFVTHTHDVSTPVAVLDALRAFAGGNLAIFAARSLIEGPAVVLWSLALLLVPWTVALALADTLTWFPSREVQLAWVVFDVLICAAMLILARRFRPRLGTVVAIAVTGDALLTLLQAALWNMPRLDSAIEAVVALAGCFAPILAAAILWRAVRRERLLARP
jgi:phosphatidylglycerol lysyltransferase